MSAALHRGAGETGPSGELINNYSGKCLDDPAQGTGTPLVQEDCYGEAGEVWADN